MDENDTIAAISTPYGTGAIAIVRTSGRDAFDTVSAVLESRVPFSKIKSHRAVHAKIKDPETGQAVDDVIVIKMESPNTYTGEDTVEINCHGGIMIQRKILGLLVKNGARPAEPGEFTRRAFLNGRMDLSQAEAVADLICAKTDFALKAALKNLEGDFSEMLRDVSSSLVRIIARIDAVIDYPDHEVEEITGREAREEIIRIKSRLEKLLGLFEKGQILKEGIKAVITGRPNVGKSSLLNRLARAEKAIVTDIPGTTRDIIEEYVSIGDIPVRVMDTAGITETTDKVERIGVERAYRSIEDADLVVLMLDASKGVCRQEMELLEKVSGRRHIVLINKVDLVENIEDIRGVEQVEAPIPTSMLDGTGLDELERRINEMFLDEESAGQDSLLANERQKFHMDKAVSSLDSAARAFDEGMPLDIMVIDVKEAAESLASITGESVAEEVLDEIFSRFCIGK